MQYIEPSTIHPALSDLIGQLALMGVEKVILYGSRAREDYADRSDIDLCVDAQDMDILKWDRVLETTKNAKTLLKIDMVYLSQVGDAMKANILREGKILYAKQ